MSQKKDENELNQNSFEYEDRISNVIITPKNKDNINQKKTQNNPGKEPKAKNNYNTINYNSISNDSVEEKSAKSKINGKNFSNAEMDILKGMKSQMGISDTQNLNEMDQQKLFDTFLLFNKFISNQNTNNDLNYYNHNNNYVNNYNNNKQNNNNTNAILTKNFKKANENYNANKDEDKNFNSVPPDYIHQRKKSKGTLSNSNLINEFKRSNSNNLNILDKTNSKEKNDANTIEEDKAKGGFDDNKNNIVEKITYENNIENNGHIKNLSETKKENNLNSKQVDIGNLNNTANFKSGFNRLKNKNKSTSFDCDYEKEKKSNNDNDNNRIILKEDSKIALIYNTEIPNINKNENRLIEYTPNKDIEFSNRTSFDIKMENLPNNFENFSAKKPESNLNNESNINKTGSNKTSNNLNFNLINKDSDKLIKNLESISSIKKFNDSFEKKNGNKNLKKKLHEEDFIPNNDALIKLNKNINHKNKDANENTSKIENFDDIPIKSSNINFFELFEKNLAAGEANIYKTINNDYGADVNIEAKKPATTKRNISKLKKEIKVNVSTKEAKKYKYYSDNFEDKLNENANANSEYENKGHETSNERIRSGKYKTEKPNYNSNYSSVVPAVSNIKNKKLGNNKSVEKTNSKKFDPASKLQEDKSFNLNLNGNLSGSTHIPKSKGKFYSSNNNKKSKNNPLMYFKLFFLF